MKWYFIVLIIYALVIFFSVLASYLRCSKPMYLMDIFVFFMVFVVSFALMPFILLIAPFYFIDNKNPRYKTFTIHELTDDNKTTLKNLGFQEGEFVSNNNIDYKGFRYNHGDIIVQHNGRVAVKYLYVISIEKKHIIKQIKNLPKDKKEVK